MTSQNSTTANNSENDLDYKAKYNTLRKKLKALVYEHELLAEELDKSQKKLLRVSKDRSFLLDRLLQYEKVGDSSSDSEATDNSESESEQKATSKKKSLTPTALSANDNVVLPKNESAISKNYPTTSESSSSPKKKSKSSKKQKLSPKADYSAVPNISMEDIEKHLESRPKMMSIEKATSLLPTEIFSNEQPFQDSEGTSDNDMDADLVIDAK